MERVGCLLVPKKGGKKSPLVLLEACVLEKTLRRYRKEYLFFLQYVLNMGAEVSCAEQLDATLYDYLLELFMENDGRGKSVALCTVCGVKLYNPGFASRLPLSAKALKGYDRLSPSEAYPPMSRGLAYVLAFYLGQKGLVLEALMVLISFEGFLRISEAVALKVDDIGFGEDSMFSAGFKGKVLLRIGQAKTGKEQSVMLFENWISVALRKVLKTKNNGEFLYGKSAETLRKQFKGALKGLRIEGKFSFHSLRHGRATEEDLKGTPLEDILRLGRWAAAKSGRHYIQSGRALMLRNSVLHLEPVCRRILQSPETFLLPLF
jgi:integrase